MKIIKVKDYVEMSEELNKIFVEQIKEKKDSVLSFTTGGTPYGMAQLFAEEINNGLDISNTIMMNLDEYVGPADGKYTVRKWMNDNIYGKIKNQPKEIHLINSDAKNKAEEIERYKAILDKYPRDVQMLGLGVNGHIGANEPGTPFTSELFVADSQESTIKATMNLFDLKAEEAPTQMYTMGFKEIMAAKCVVLAASGKAKAEAVKNTIEGEISEMVPASYLRNHDNFIFIIDEDAASLLSK